MGKRYTGKIVELHKNHGLIETTVEDHRVRLFFNIVPSMLDSNGNPSLHEIVSFETRHLTWHGINIVCAYNLKDEGGVIAKVTSLHIKETDFSRFLFASLRPDSLPGKRTLDGLIDAERKVCLFYLKWILFVEKSTKLAIKKAMELSGLTSSWLIAKLEGISSTKKIIKNALENVKEKTWLLSTSSFVSFKQRDNDPNDVVVSDAPIELLLSTVTLGELSDILVVIFPDLSAIAEKEPDLHTYLWYAEGMLADLSVIRNAAAHGNVVTPLIVDDTFSPAYFYEMSDAFPQWNSNVALNDAERYKPFSFIRYLAKGEAKGGVSLTGLPIFSPQIEALFFTKSLFLNPAKKSLFSLFFLIHAVFSFVERDSREQFYGDLHMSGLSFFDGDEESAFTGYPSKNYSISSKLFRVLYIILKYGGESNFKGLATICKEISSNAE